MKLRNKMKDDKQMILENYKREILSFQIECDNSIQILKKIV